MRPPKGGRIGENRDEREGVGESKVAGRGEESGVAGRGRSWADAVELPAGEAVVAAVPEGRGGGAEAWQRGAAIESSVREGVPGKGPGVGAGEVQRGGGRALWSDAGGGASGLGGRTAAGCRDAATLDAGGRVVEWGAEEEATPAEARAQGALRRDGADGW